MSMKDMTNHQRAVIQAIKAEPHVEGEVDLARRKKKAVVISTEDKLY